MTPYERLMFWQNLADQRQPPFHTPDPREKRELAKRVRRQVEDFSKRTPLEAVEAGDVIGSKARHALGLAWGRYKSGLRP